VSGPDHRRAPLSPADPTAFDTEGGIPFSGAFTPSGEMRVSETTPVETLWTEVYGRFLTGASRWGRELLAPR